MSRLVMAKKIMHWKWERDISWRWEKLRFY